MEVKKSVSARERDTYVQFLRSEWQKMETGGGCPPSKGARSSRNGGVTRGSHLDPAQPQQQPQQQPPPARRARGSPRKPSASAPVKAAPPPLPLRKKWSSSTDNSLGNNGHPTLSALSTETPSSRTIESLAAILTEQYPGTMRGEEDGASLPPTITTTTTTTHQERVTPPISPLLEMGQGVVATPPNVRAENFAAAPPATKRRTTSSVGRRHNNAQASTPLRRLPRSQSAPPLQSDGENKTEPRKSCSRTKKRTQQSRSNSTMRRHPQHQPPPPPPVGSTVTTPSSNGRNVARNLDAGGGSPCAVRVASLSSAATTPSSSGNMERPERLRAASQPAHHHRRGGPLERAAARSVRRGGGGGGGTHAAPLTPIQRREPVRVVVKRRAACAAVAAAAALVVGVTCGGEGDYQAWLVELVVRRHVASILKEVTTLWRAGSAPQDMPSTSTLTSALSASQHRATDEVCFNLFPPINLTKPPQQKATSASSAPITPKMRSPIGYDSRERQHPPGPMPSPSDTHENPQQVLFMSKAPLTLPEAERDTTAGGRQSMMDLRAAPGRVQGGKDVENTECMWSAADALEAPRDERGMAVPQHGIYVPHPHPHPHSRHHHHHHVGMYYGPHMIPHHVPLSVHSPPFLGAPPGSPQTMRKPVHRSHPIPFASYPGGAMPCCSPSQRGPGVFTQGNGVQPSNASNSGMEEP